MTQSHWGPPTLSRDRPVKQRPGKGEDSFGGRQPFAADSRGLASANSAWRAAGADAWLRRLEGTLIWSRVRVDGFHGKEKTNLPGFQLCGPVDNSQKM